MLSLAGLPLLLLTLLLGTVRANVVLMTSTNETFQYPDLEATFGERLPASGIRGVMYGASPSDGCSTLTNSTRPEPPLYYAFVLLKRGVCTFETKVRNAQAGGFDAAIVYNNEGDDLVTMTGDPEGIHIHAVFVPKSAGEKMLSYADDMGTFCYIRRSYETISWVVIIVVVVTSLLAIIAAVAIYCFLRRHRHYSTMIYRILNGEELTSQFSPNALRYE